MVNKYNEAITTSTTGEKVTWGFELECIYLKRCAEDIQNLFKQEFGTVLATEPDASLKAKVHENTYIDKIVSDMLRTKEDNQEKYDKAFNVTSEWLRGTGSYQGTEFKSPVLKADPQGIVKAYKTLEKAFTLTKNVSLYYGNLDGPDGGQCLLKDLPVLYTNDTCALHIHMGLNLRDNWMQELLWINYQLSLDLNIMKQFKTYYEEPFVFDFFSDKYATLERLQTNHIQLKAVLEDSKNKKEYIEKLERHILINFSYITTKMQITRPHSELGTLEWRGPRSFLDSRGFVSRGLKNLFTNFIMKFVKTIVSLHENTHVKVGGFIITKKEFFAAINKVQGSSALEHNKDIHYNLFKTKLEEKKKRNYPAQAFKEGVDAGMVINFLERHPDVFRNIELIKVDMRKANNDIDKYTIKLGRIKSKLPYREKPKIPAYLRAMDEMIIDGFYMDDEEVDRHVFEKSEFINGQIDLRSPMLNKHDNEGGDLFFEYSVAYEYLMEFKSIRESQLSNFVFPYYNNNLTIFEDNVVNNMYFYVSPNPSPGSLSHFKPPKMKNNGIGILRIVMPFDSIYNLDDEKNGRFFNILENDIIKKYKDENEIDSIIFNDTDKNENYTSIKDIEAHYSKIFAAHFKNVFKLIG